MGIPGIGLLCIGAFAKSSQFIRRREHWPGNRKIGNWSYGVGALIGASTVWLIRSLPLYGGPGGRLLGLYIIGAGLAAVFIGAIIRDFRRSKRDQNNSNPTR